MKIFKPGDRIHLVSREFWEVKGQNFFPHSLIESMIDEYENHVFIVQNTEYSEEEEFIWGNDEGYQDLFFNDGNEWSWSSPMFREFYEEEEKSINPLDITIF